MWDIFIQRRFVKPDVKLLTARERLRKRYRPDRVRILFVGEAPPASGRFFYQADSGLYRAVRDTFISAFPNLQKAHFLESFRALGCYLVDLCGQPVDRMDRKARQRVCLAGEASLNRTLRQLRPKIVVAVVRSISGNVRRAEDQAKWSGLHVELPYPGRWVHHRAEFSRKLIPLLRKSLSSMPEIQNGDEVSEHNHTDAYDDRDAAEPREHKRTVASAGRRQGNHNDVMNPPEEPC
jgi:hypothetical protein